MTAKEKYRQLCETEGARIPLFQQYWWMETVCRGKRWDVLLAERADGTVEGALPYLTGSKLGLRYIVQPQLTQFNGPWYNLPDGLTPAARTEFENRVGGELASQLEGLRLSLYAQNFAPEVTNWLPFCWKGYRQTTRYTYRFPSLADPDALMAAASRVRRRHLDEVAQRCTVDRQVPPEEFAPLHEAYYRSRGGDEIARTLLLHLCTTAIARGQGLLWGLRDTHGTLQAAWFVAFDSRCAYSLLLALGKQAPPNAMTYLMWQVLRHLSALTEAFDFEGSIEPGLEQFYRSFGTVQTPYHHVTRSRPAILNTLLKA